jgi:hypothetical protein
MFPVAADRLSLSEIAALWAEEMTPDRTATEVRFFLEKAWWRGEFAGDGPSRLDVLKVLRWGPVPEADPKAWTEQECQSAFEAIADYWPYESVPGIAMTAPLRAPRDWVVAGRVHGLDRSESL